MGQWQATRKKTAITPTDSLQRESEERLGVRQHIKKKRNEKKEKKPPYPTAEQKGISRQQLRNPQSLSPLSLPTFFYPVRGYISSMRLNDHLSNTSSTQCFAPHKFLSLDTSQPVEESRNGQDHCCGDQAGSVFDKAEPLDQCHNQVDSCAPVIGVKFTHEIIEFFRGRAYA